MTTYTRPLGGGTPTTGQVVEAVHVNDPIDQIYDTILAGGITADQIAAGAVDTAELATEAVTRAKMDGTIPDETEMATSGAPTTDAMVANKKYIDDEIATATEGGTPTTLDSLGAAMVKFETGSAVYQAQTPGFVNAFVEGSTSNRLLLEVGATSTPGVDISRTGSGSTGVDRPDVMAFVPKDFFFDVKHDNQVPTITWTPLVTGGGAPVKQ